MDSGLVCHAGNCAVATCPRGQLLPYHHKPRKRRYSSNYLSPVGLQPNVRRISQPPSGGTTHYLTPAGLQPGDRRKSQRARHNIAQPDGFCKREARGVDLRPRPERRAPQGASRQSEIAPHLGKKTKKNGERDGTRTRNIHRDRVAL